MSDLIVPKVICFQTQKQLTTLQNIGVLLKGVLIDLHARNFVYARNHACNLLSPAVWLRKGGSSVN